MKISNLFFPENYSCLICSEDIFYNKYLVCKSCLKNLSYVGNNICLHCGEPLVSDGNYCKRCKGKNFIYDKAMAPFLYLGEAKNFVMGLKYSGKKYNAKSMAMFMTDCFIKSKLKINYIIPVPLSETRYKQRGYNQAEILANYIAKNLNKPLMLNILKRVKDTPTQTNLDFVQRFLNLKDAFVAYKSKDIKDSNILIIDDVFTTGATVSECAKILKDIGAKNVYALTFAHTVLKEE